MEILITFFVVVFLVVVIKSTHKNSGKKCVLNFWRNYSAKEKNLPYPRNFCLSCPWNRGR